MFQSNKYTRRPPFFQFMKEDGLSLIEVAIALVIIGILTVPIMAQYKIDAIDNKHKNTVGNINNAVEAINNFYISENEYYPCPASLTSGLDDDDFGAQADECALDTDISDIELCTNLSWVNAGICKTTDDPATAIIIGALPFADLKMSQGQELDSWGNKLIYAIGFNQTKVSTFNDDSLIIPLSADASSDPAADGIPDQLKDTMGDDLFYQYIIFSTGYNGVGGFTKDGILISQCSNPSNELSELENCDFDNTFLVREDPNITGASVVASGALFYDEQTSGKLTTDFSLWYGESGNDDLAISQATRIGIGTQDPKYSLHVSDNTKENANMLIESTVDGNGDHIGGKLKTNNICSETTQMDCFNPIIIAGDVPEMQCDEDRAVNELSKNRVTCTTTEDAVGNEINGNSLSTNNTFSGECTEIVSGGGSVPRPATGFNNSGELTCN